MFESFCTGLGFVIVTAAVMAVGVFVMTALMVGSIEIFSDLKNKLTSRKQN